jgi:hypothetical protein
MALRRQGLHITGIARPCPTAHGPGATLASRHVVIRQTTLAVLNAALCAAISAPSARASINVDVGSFNVLQARSLAPPSQVFVARGAGPSRAAAVASLSCTADLAESEPQACPQLTGLPMYICYGPCCELDWGPGGPICLALSAATFRYAMPYTWIQWMRKSHPDAEMVVDYKALAFSAVLYASAAPRTAAGVAYSWLFLVLCLL